MLADLSFPIIWVAWPLNGIWLFHPLLPIPLTKAARIWPESARIGRSNLTTVATNTGSNGIFQEYPLISRSNLTTVATNTGSNGIFKNTP